MSGEARLAYRSQRWTCGCPNPRLIDRVLELPHGPVIFTKCASCERAKPHFATASRR